MPPLLHRQSISSLAQCCRFALSFFLVLGLTFVVYTPGLSGKFAFDDGPNILNNSSLAIQSLNFASLKQAALSGNSGPLKRPISMLSFAVNDYCAGLDPYYFKLTNLVIHLLNGIALFVLTTLLLSVYRQRFQPLLSERHIRWVSLAVATAWLLHPLNLTGVLYIVQRMTSLSTFFTLLALIAYTRGRIRLTNGSRGGVTHILAAFLLFFPLALLSKENGVLLPLFTLILEITLLNFETQTITGRRFLIGLYVVVLAIPACALLVYLAAHPEYILGGYHLRDFTLSERLLTETRVIWFYLAMIALPRVGAMGLFHDDIPLSHSLLDPTSTPFAILGLMALLVTALALRKRQPIFAFGVLLFLAGHSLESTAIPLEITFEHRNYLPMYGILLIIFYYVLYPLTHLRTLRVRQLGAILLIGLFAVGTAIRANHWGNLFLLSITEVTHHPLSHRANSEMGAMYGILATTEKNNSEQYFQLARQHFETSASLQKNSTDGLFGLIYYTSIQGKPIENSWLIDLQQRLEHAPFAGNSASKLVSLGTCQMEHKCHLSKDDIKLLLDAAIRNPTLAGLTRAAVFVALSFHLANVEQDTPGALDATYKAVEAAPNEPEYRANLISFLIALNRLEEAKKQLKSARAIDTLGTYTQEFEELEKKIRAEKPAHNAALIGE